MMTATSACSQGTRYLLQSSSSGTCNMTSKAIWSCSNPRTASKNYATSVQTAAVTALCSRNEFCAIATQHCSPLTTHSVLGTCRGGCTFCGCIQAAVGTLHHSRMALRCCRGGCCATAHTCTGMVA